MKAFLEVLARILDIIVGIVKGDQPKREEVESATSDLEKQNSKLKDELEREIEAKEKRK